MRTENWNGYEIRFVAVDGEWWAVLKDVCDALSLSNPTVVASRIDEDMKIKVDPKLNLGSKSNEPISNPRKSWYGTFFGRLFYETLLYICVKFFTLL